MVENFKQVLTTDASILVGRYQKKIIIHYPFSLTIEIDKNNQIHDIQPRTFKGVDLFSRYHGRTRGYVDLLIEDMLDLFTENYNG